MIGRFGCCAGMLVALGCGARTEVEEQQRGGGGGADVGDTGGGGGGGVVPLRCDALVVDAPAPYEPPSGFDRDENRTLVAIDAERVLLITTPVFPDGRSGEPTGFTFEAWGNWPPDMPSATPIPHAGSHVLAVPNGDGTLALSTTMPSMNSDRTAAFIATYDPRSGIASTPLLLPARDPSWPSNGLAGDSPALLLRTPTGFHTGWWTNFDAPARLSQLPLDHAGQALATADVGSGCGWTLGGTFAVAVGGRALVVTAGERGFGECVPDGGIDHETERRTIVTMNVDEQGVIRHGETRELPPGSPRIALVERPGGAFVLHYDSTNPSGGTSSLLAWPVDENGRTAGPDREIDRLEPGSHVTATRLGSGFAVRTSDGWQTTLTLYDHRAERLTSATWDANTDYFDSMLSAPDGSAVLSTEFGGMQNQRIGVVRRLRCVNGGTK